MQARQPLLLADDLCEYSRNLLQKDSAATDENNEQNELAADGSGTNPQNGADSNNRQTGGKNREKARKAALKAQQRQLVKKYSKVK